MERKEGEKKERKTRRRERYGVEDSILKGAESVIYTTAVMVLQL